ncbi:hypothetical protein J6590_085422 [Homalodisca vitripennis]|nr:hypothetical protein J6590_085422 [Homalodisca vitripennis]
MATRSMGRSRTAHTQVTSLVEGSLWARWRPGSKDISRIDGLDRFCERQRTVSRRRRIRMKSEQDRVPKS